MVGDGLSAILIEVRFLLFTASLAAAMVLFCSESGADHRKNFAHFLSIDESNVAKTTGYKLKQPAGFTHVVLGRYADGKYEHSAIVLMTCDRKACNGETVHLRGGSLVKLTGLIDLAGKAGPIERNVVSDHGTGYQEIGGPKPLQKPALVFEGEERENQVNVEARRGTISGTRVRKTMTIIALWKGTAKHRRVVFAEDTVNRGASGAGASTTFSLGTDKHGGVRDISALEQRHLDRRSRCLRPKPTSSSYQMKKGRYEHVELLPRRTGC